MQRRTEVGTAAHRRPFFDVFGRSQFKVIEIKAGGNDTGNQGIIRKVRGHASPEPMLGGDAYLQLLSGFQIGSKELAFDASALVDEHQFKRGTAVIKPDLVAFEAMKARDFAGLQEIVDCRGIGTAALNPLGKRV